MHKNLEIPARHLACALLLVTATGCGWVDSTGAQGTVVSPSANAINTLRNAQPLGLIEETSLTAELEGEGAELENWSWLPEDTNVDTRCASINGFDTSLAASSLTDACTNADECTVAIDESRGEDVTRFTLRMPKLRAPVALSYQLTTTRDDGAQVMRQQLLCGLSMNEAPLATDDEYLAPRNELRIVSPQDADNLLANDQDDDDVRNQPLQVLTTPVTAPLFATQFSLDSDGGFIYQPIDDLPDSDSGFIEDSFVYAITDGLHTVNATAVVRIVDGNRSPQRIQRIPDVTLTASTLGNIQAPVEFELTRYFADPDSDKLSFSITTGTQSASRQIATVRGNVLSLQGFEDSVGERVVEIVASDGLESTTDSFVVIVRSTGEDIVVADNREPTVTDISNRIVQNRFTYDVSGFFNDADEDKMTFTAVGLPEGIVISSEGVISGRSVSDNRGTWFIRVTADDNRGGTVTDGFLLVIN